ncbi:hypothetical protein BH23CHL5_BH23CHL5_15720 [soil metagenome]
MGVRGEFPSVSTASLSERFRVALGGYWAALFGLLSIIAIKLDEQAPKPWLRSCIRVSRTHTTIKLITGQRATVSKDQCPLERSPYTGCDCLIERRAGGALSYART